MRRLSLFLVALSVAGMVPAFCSAQSDSALASGNAVPANAVIATPAAESTSRAAAGGVQPGDSSTAAPGPLPQAASVPRERMVGIGVTISTLGIGGQIAARVMRRANVRAGFNGTSWSDTLPIQGINYAGTLHFRSVETHFDYYIFRSFHISPGFLIYNGNNITAVASVPSGALFEVGGQIYQSGAVGGGTAPIGGNATIRFNRVAPELLIGTGNLVPRSRSHWSFTDEFGIDYQGSPQLALGLTGSACLPPNSTGPTCVDAATDPMVQSSIRTQQSRFNQNASKYYFRLWPVFTSGLSYSF